MASYLEDRIDNDLISPLRSMAVALLAYLFFFLATGLVLPTILQPFVLIPYWASIVLAPLQYAATLLALVEYRRNIRCGLAFFTRVHLFAYLAAILLFLSWIILTRSWLSLGILLFFFIIRLLLQWIRG